jgi:hypothetical protein
MREVTRMPELEDEYLRAALRDLRDSALPALRPPNLDEVERLASRRQSVNTGTLVGVAVLLLIGAIVLANLTKPPPARPTPTATPAVTQSSGPATTLSPSPTATATTPTAGTAFAIDLLPITLTAGSGGDREGVIEITVRALGPVAGPGAVLIETRAGRGTGGDWDRCGAESDADWSLCDLGVLAVGSAMTLRLPIRVGPELPLDDGRIGTITVRADRNEYEPVTIRVANP